MSSRASSPSPSLAAASQDAHVTVAKALGNLANDDNIGSQLTGLSPKAYRDARLAEGDGDSDSDPEGSQDRGQRPQGGASSSHQAGDDNEEDDSNNNSQRSSQSHVSDSQKSQRSTSSTASHISVAAASHTNPTGASATTPSHSVMTAVKLPATAPPPILAAPNAPSAVPTVPTAAPAATTSPSVPNLHDARMRYVDAWAVSARTLIHAVVDDELAVGTLTGLDKKVVGGLLYTLVIAYDQNVLEGLLLGDLPARLRYTPPLEHVLGKMMEEAQEAADEARKLPGIYGNWLVDAQGQSPTPTELRSMIEKARDYVDEDGDSDVANRVDKQKTPIVRRATSAGGLRKYLSKDDGRTITERVAHIENFCDQLEARLDLVPASEVDRPLRAPLCEFGFSINLTKRLKDHKTHVNSNYIMNLFEAVAMTLHGSKFAIEQHVVNIIPWGHLCELAEIFATRIGFGMTGLGGGFSHQLPGRNNSSAYKVSDEDWEEAEQVAGRVVNIEQKEKLYSRQLKNEQESVRAKVKEQEKYEALMKERDEKREQLHQALQPLAEEMEYCGRPD
ncbi:hypothetical protein KC340_g6382 [Hortaea werneckii]|nr:hypothetical protein KC342_g4585 [Hortaea werneckii]KAI7102295.1 hypothetical protein KC339_g6094 [Hortaea werneckii]KAI7243406.1 hypothetical protein KC365_g2296 [Hortaea werneckii]KAI7324432.1 hypothetical protein KC340_g6382 [Hortaea werneckii]KAI7381877.1 hypothetical protein KC328_g11997 [Hortaea werneckii]